MAFTKMDPKENRRWVAALRSGKYRREQYTLKRDSRHFCVLGVYCDISNAGAWERAIGQSFYRVGEEASAIYLPSNLRKRIKLTKSAQYALVDMSDAGQSFREMADWIEANL